MTDKEWSKKVKSTIKEIKKGFDDHDVNKVNEKFCFALGYAVARGFIKQDAVLLASLPELYDR